MSEWVKEGDLTLPITEHGGPCWVRFRLGFVCGSCVCLLPYWHDAFAELLKEREEDAE